MGRKRGEDGTFEETVTLNAVKQQFETAEIPVLTASEIANDLECSRPTAYNKLEELVEEGHLHKKKVGGRAVVYIRLNEEGRLEH